MSLPTMPGRPPLSQPATPSAAPQSKPLDLKSTAGRRLLKGRSLDEALALSSAGRYETTIVYPRAAAPSHEISPRELVLFVADDCTVTEAW